MWLISFFFFVEDLAVYGIVWEKNVLEPDRLKMPIRRMRVTCWMRTATNTFPEYVTLIASPPQQWSQERASMLRYTYIACLVALHKLIPHDSTSVRFPVVFCNKVLFVFDLTALDLHGNC